MDVNASIEGGSHLSSGGKRTLATIGDVTPRTALRAGDAAAATDGDITRRAVVDSVDREVVSLVALWDAPVSV